MCTVLPLWLPHLCPAPAELLLLLLCLLCQEPFTVAVFLVTLLLNSTSRITLPSLLKREFHEHRQKSHRYGPVCGRGTVQLQKTLVAPLHLSSLSTLQMLSNHFFEPSNHEISRKSEQQVHLELIFIRARLVWVFSPAAENKTDHNM